MRDRPRNYFVELFDKTIASIDASQTKPKILLHACCAPCSTAVLELLSPIFQIVLFFNGHNIYPREEYDRRLAEVYRFTDIARRDFQAQIELVVIPPKIAETMDKLAFGKDMPENGARCHYCYALRLKEAMDYARAHQIPYITTVMTISRQKCSEKINGVAHSLMDAYPDLTYVYSDFKKRGGNMRSSELCKIYQLYQQNYCGCKFSLFR